LGAKIALCNSTGRAAATTAESSTDVILETFTDVQEVLQLLQAENEHLHAELATQASRTQSPTPIVPELVAVLEAFTRQLRQSPSTDRLYRSAKISDPPVLTDRTDPMFENWKIQLQDKLTVNTDYFETEEARKAYVFGRTGMDIQTYLQPRYTDNSVNPFKSAEDIIGHLASIYKDLYKVQNARYNYRSLRIKSTEKFTEFQTRFLQLAGQARILPDNLMPDMFDKLTLELCCTILPQYTTITALKELTDQYQAVDQGLRHIKAETDRLKKNQAFTEKYRVRKPDYTLHQAFIEYNQSVKPAQAPVCNRGSVL
jgi:hypothetical protein